MISIYDKNESNFITNGLAVLNCKSCIVTEKLNGEYELELEHPFDERSKWQYLLEDNIVKAEGQLFRIYRKVKTMSGIRVNAHHISYDLVDNLVEYLDIRGLSGVSALDSVLTNSSYPHNFIGTSDITTINSIDIDDPNGDIINKNPLEALAILQSIYGGEYIRDNFNLKLLTSRGQDRGVLISYGKNILGIEEDIDSTNIITRILPIGFDGLTIPEKFVDSPNINSFPHPKLKPIEFSECESEEDLRAAAQQYFIDTRCDYPISNYKINFIELSKTEEYKHYSILETVYLGDTVTVRHSRLNINLKCKVIGMTKNALTNKIENIELGDFKPNLVNTMNSIQSSANLFNSMLTKNSNINVSFLEGAIKAATNLLISSGDGHVIQDQNGISIMDTLDKNTTQKVWRWNINGLGYSSTGWNGPFRTAITADGHIVADFIDTGSLTAAIIKSGILSSFNNKTKINLDDGTLNIGDKLTYDGTDLIFSEGVIKWLSVDDIVNISKLTSINQNGIYTGELTAQQINAVQGITLGANATIDWNTLAKPTYNAAEVGARPSTWKPDYSNDISGIKPPSDADNTYSTIGYNRLTKIDSTGVYTGTVEASKIIGVEGLYQRINIYTGTGSGSISIKDSNNTERIKLWASGASSIPEIELRDYSGYKTASLTQDGLTVYAGANQSALAAIGKDVNGNGKVYVANVCDLYASGVSFYKSVSVPSLTINGSTAATQTWVAQNYASASHEHTGKYVGYVSGNSNIVALPQSCYIDCTGGTPRLQYSANTYMQVTSAGFNFFIGGKNVGYIDATGYHVNP